MTYLCCIGKDKSMSSNKTNNGKKGGLLSGKPHYDKNGKPVGGIKAIVTDSGKPVELEGGEVIINKHAAKLHWQELSKINQSAGGGVPIKNPNTSESDEDPEEYKDGGTITFNINKIPKGHIYRYAKNIKDNHPEIWKKAGNIFGNEAFVNLERVYKRGYWLDSEEWMFIKWRSYVARHKQDFRIEGVIAMLKWLDQVDKGWPYMKNLIDEEISRLSEKGKKSKMAKGGQLKEGAKVEREHIKTIKAIRDKKVSLEKAPELIAKDHLKENPNYYKIIQRLHLKKGGNILLNIAKKNSSSDLVNIASKGNYTNAKYHQKYSTKNGHEINIVIFEKLDDNDYYYIGAYDNDGKELAFAVVEKKGKNYHSIASDVNENFRRQGIMSAMLDLFDEQIGQIVPTNSITDEERKMWLKRKPTIFTEIDINTSPVDDLFSDGGNIDSEIIQNDNPVLWQMTKQEFCDFATARNFKLHLKSSNRILSCNDYYDIAVISPIISENRSNNPILLALKTNQLPPERVQKIVDSTSLLSESSNNKQVQAIWQYLRSSKIEFWKVPMSVWLSSDYYKKVSKDVAQGRYRQIIIDTILHHDKQIKEKLEQREITYQNIIDRLTESNIENLDNFIDKNFWKHVGELRLIDDKYSVKYKLKYLVDLINSSSDLQVEKNSTEITAINIKNILNKAQIPFHYDLSYKNGSEYWSIGGKSYRVSDHDKPEGSFGYDRFKDKKGITDFRDRNKFYDQLSKDFDLSDKSEQEAIYKKEAKKYISVTKDGYRQPDGSLFDSMDNALNNMWRLKKELPKGEKNSTENSSKQQEFVNEMIELQTNKSQLNKTQVEKIAKKYGIERQNDVKELTELSIVTFARSVAHKSELTLKERYNEIVDIYKNQVNLSHRTSESILLQQYSTPAPIGFVMGLFCGFNKGGNFFEPSAGNGLLTIAGLPKDFIVNEIDGLRNSNLQLQGYKEVLKLDGSDANNFNRFKNYFDAVITNPPFGTMDAVDVDGFQITSLEQYMAILALSCMKPDGKCAIIIGGHNEYDEKGRIKAGKNRMFFTWLYSKYNVSDVINISGRHLYSRQGTAFNTRIILIDGQASEKKFPPLVPTSTPSNEIMSKAPVDNFDILWERIHKSI